MLVYGIARNPDAEFFKIKYIINPKEFFMKGFGNQNKFNKKSKKSNKKINPSKSQIIIQALKLHSQGNILEAAKYYQYFINQGFLDFRVFSNYGNILICLNKLKEAELSFRKAIALKPDLPGAHLNLGNVLRDLGKLKEAELSFRKAITLKPDYAEAHFNLGNIMNNLRKLKDSELSYRKAITIRPDFAEAHLNLGNVLRDLGMIKEAELSYRKAITIKPDFAEADLNLGKILHKIGKLKEAELSFRKAITLKPDYAEAHFNLGNIMNNIGKLQEAELSYRKAIAIKPDYAYAYFFLSNLQYSNTEIKWKDQLFSENILINKTQKEQVDIYFARANILHRDKKYKESSKYLKLANNLKLNLNPSNSDTFIKISNTLLIESDKKEIHKKIETKISSESIFIVGMPRSGSTLLESILSMRIDLYDLGEINILKESFLEYKKSKKAINLAELYEKKVNNKTELNITTNKYLYNYQYAGIIAHHLPNAKIIHCYRNPLDNILSIYRANFASGNEYSSSLEDCARVYLDQEEVMSNYKNRFRSKIYDLNYDSLVRNPDKEIKSLISWLGWEWNDSYLSPHINTRSVLTASSVQVRYPINSKSSNGWKNYKEMLKPATEILIRTERYRDLLL